MTIPVATKNAMLNGQAFDQASLHTGYPGTTGANEVSGGSPAYARKTITINAASGGTRSLNAAVTFDVPATTVRWVGYWSGGVFVCCAPNGGATPKNFMAIPSTDTVYSTSHGWAANQKIVFFNGTPPGGVTEGTIYYVINPATDTFQVSASSGGAAVDITAASSFGCVVCAITEDVYAAQGTHQLASTTVTIPD